MQLLEESQGSVWSYSQELQIEPEGGVCGPHESTLA